VGEGGRQRGGDPVEREPEREEEETIDGNWKRDLGWEEGKLRVGERDLVMGDGKPGMGKRDLGMGDGEPGWERGIYGWEMESHKLEKGI
jgi:hypothetical protein